MSYTSHSFSVELAAKIGLEETLVLQHFYFWHEHNASIKSMNMDGLVWCYASVSRINEVFPYLTPKTIRNAIQRLVDGGYIAKGNKGEGAKKMDRTSWYALTEAGEALFGAVKREEHPFAPGENAFAQRENAIAEKANIDNNKDNNNTSSNEEDIYSAKGIFDFRKSLIELGVKPDTADQWMLVRKRKGAVNTKAAFDTIAKEIAKAAPITAEACIYRAVAESWRGFKAEWLHDKAPQAGSTTPQPPSGIDTRPRPRHDKHLDVDFSQFYPD